MTMLTMMQPSLWWCRISEFREIIVPVANFGPADGEIVLSMESNTCHWNLGALIPQSMAVTAADNYYIVPAINLGSGDEWLERLSQ